MRITDEIRILKETKEIDKDLVVGMIAEAYQLREDGKDTEKERFLLGLRYPEFFSKNEDDMVGAYRRAAIYRDKIGISFEYIIKALSEQYGLN